MAIINYLIESLIDEDLLMFERLLYEEDEGDATTPKKKRERKPVQKPDNYSDRKSDSGFESTFSVTGKPLPARPKRNQWYSDESFEQAMKIWKDQMDKKDEIEDKTFDMKTSITYLCGRNAINVSFKPLHGSYSDELNIDKPGLILKGVTYSVAQAMQNAPCDIDRIEFEPMPSSGDSERDKNKRAAVYKAFAKKYLPTIGREIERMSPEDGMPESGGLEKVIYYLAPLGGTQTSPTEVSMVELIRNGDVDAIRDAIATGTSSFTDESIKHALDARNGEVFHFILKNKDIGILDFKHALTSPNINSSIVNSMLNKLDMDELVADRGLINHVIVNMKPPILKAFIRKGFKPTNDHYKMALDVVKEGDPESARPMIDLLNADGEELDEMFAHSAIKAGNVDLVKYLFDKGILKMSPELVKIPTSKEVKKLISQKMWNR